MIVAAAVKFAAKPPPEGYQLGVVDFICYVPPPGRHHNVLHSLFYQFGPGAQRTGTSYGSEVQGFITDKGEFLDRRAALIHARECGQPLLRKHGEGYQGDELFSEDLW